MHIIHLFTATIKVIKERPLLYDSIIITFIILVIIVS